MTRVLVTPLLAASLVAGGCGGNAPAKKLAPSAATPPPAKGAPITTYTRAPDFVLRDQRSRIVRLSDQHGRVVLLTFLYTHCPDVCPLIADNLNGVLHDLGPERNDVRVLAVTVDPAHDTRGAIRTFIREHGLLPQFRYLTGPLSRLRRIWQNYNVLSLRRNERRVDHSALTLLIDRGGDMRMYYAPNVASAPILGDVRRYLPRAEG
jgi:protein SCO1